METATLYTFSCYLKKIYMATVAAANCACLPLGPHSRVTPSILTETLSGWSVNITLMSSQSDNDNDAVSSQTPPPQKKVKRLQKYRHEWEEAYPWLSSVRGDLYKANCNACRRIFSVSHGGLSDIKQHASGEQHSRNVRSQKNQSVVSQFFMTETSPETDSVCEIMLCSYYLWF